MSKTKIRFPNWLVTWTLRRGRPVVWILSSAVVAVGLTIIFYRVGAPLDPSTHLGAIFASWVGGVAIFVAGSMVIGLASLVPPEASAFDARARILFRNQSGQHIDYIIQRIRHDFGQYSDFTKRTIFLDEVDPETGKLHVQVDTTTKLKGYVDDIESIASSTITLNKLCAPPAGRTISRLVYVRINGEPLEELNGDTPEEYQLPNGDIDFKYPTKVPAGGHTTVQTLWECWAESGESHTHAPVRHTRVFQLSFENNSDRDVKLKYAVRGGADQETAVKRGATRDLISEPDVNPDERVYDLRVEVI